MYVWARLAKVVATARLRGPCTPLDESVLNFRCLPSDVDNYLHMNNAKYPMLADVGRLDLFLRSGLIKSAREHGWGPMMGGVQTVFLREIKLWRKFTLRSSFETWDSQQIVGRHRFVLEDGRTSALIFTTAGIYDFRNKRFVPIDEVVEVLGQPIARRPLTEDESLFLQSHSALRRLAKTIG